MIIEVIRTAAESVEQLAGKVFPVAEVVDELEPPFCIYNTKSSEPLRVMSGQTICTTDTLELGFEAEMLDDAIAAAKAVEDKLLALANTVTASGERILWIRCSQSEEDALDIATEKMRHPLTVEVCWQ